MHMSTVYPSDNLPFLLVSIAIITLLMFVFCYALGQYSRKHKAEHTTQRKSTKEIQAMTEAEYRAYIESYLGDMAQAFNTQQIACDMMFILNGQNPKMITDAQLNTILNNNFGK